ncbi:DUF6864 domain-containing function [Photobacterium swingsii]|uniref:DUF6864 domain-containing function n=1 Tax=Photobacterium swingsii TaxID=680026 RepID=UPI0040695877
MIDTIKYPLKITTQGYSVIASGVVHTLGTEVKFELANLIIKYKFITDSNGVKFDADVVNGELVINLYNFSSSLGEGKLEPAEIGTLGGKRLFATWFVNTVQSNLRQFNYTFLLMDD